jgi:hypothetical protein
MHAVSESKHRLIVTHDSSRFTRFFAGAGVAALALAGWRYHQYDGVSEYFWGAIGAAGMCLFVAAVFFERSRFVVDAGLGMVEWQRSRLFGSRAGTVGFNQVRGVASERPIGRDQGMRRVVLHTDEGDLPVSVAYVPDPHDVALGLTLKIRLMIGLPDAGTDVPEEVHSLAAAGRTVDAACALRRHRGVSLQEAHTTVRQLPRKRR